MDAEIKKIVSSIAPNTRRAIARRDSGIKYLDEMSPITKEDLKSGVIYIGFIEFKPGRVNVYTPVLRRRRCDFASSRVQEIASVCRVRLFPQCPLKAGSTMSDCQGGTPSSTWSNTNPFTFTFTFTFTLNFTPCPFASLSPATLPSPSPSLLHLHRRYFTFTFVASH
jgi:hypothetical protein